MGKLILLAAILVTGLQTLRAPFVGAMAYYCLAIWGPQYIWWWNFEGLRVSFIVAVTTISALVIAVFRQGLKFDLLSSRINVCVLILWTSYVISYLFAPYVALLGEVPYLTFIHFSKIIFFYFVAVLVVDDIQKQKYFSFIIIAALLHLTWWANYQYLSQNWQAFNMGRLMGPTFLGGGSIYGDENAFAMFFVTAAPFLFYWGLHLARPVARYAIWAVIPFAWHAVFLTGSRGGLVGLAATLFAGVIFSKKRYLLICILIPLFLLAFYFQGGDLLKSRTETIVDFEGESSAEARLQAWRAAVEMVQAHPVTGVGIACFIQAMSDFSDKHPRATHSVPLQFAAEVGILGLVAYCLIVGFVLWQGFQNNRLLSIEELKIDEKELALLHYLNEASVVSFFGLSVCALFLSLNYYEVFYFLLIIAGYIRYHIHCKLMSHYQG